MKNINYVKGNISFKKINQLNKNPFYKYLLNTPCVLGVPRLLSTQMEQGTRQMRFLLLRMNKVTKKKKKIRVYYEENIAII